ncbi:MAG: oligoendopeptidase F, partial [Clostridia bacterium]|nr:oligoendopeptidase F [Clostridia bacterium]
VPDVRFEIPYQEAVALVTEGLAPLGEEYVSVLRTAFRSGWVDVPENEGKRGGAYATGVYGVHPYVLLNYHPNLNNLFTVAHEMGHAMHTYFAHRSQPYVYADYTIFIAEVASTLNEQLLLHHLLGQTADPRRRLRLLNHALEQYRTVLYRQVMFAEFERIIHDLYERGEALTDAVFCDIYLRLNREYHGPDVVQDEPIALEWARIPHFYTAFYVYKYATGLAAAATLARAILAGEPSARQRYIDLLRAGGSDDPLNLLRRAGIDLTTPTPVETALRTFAALLDEVEGLADAVAGPARPTA